MRKNRFALIEKHRTERTPLLPPMIKPPTHPYAQEIIKRTGMKPAPNRQPKNPEIAFADMKMGQLKAIAKEQGLKYKVGMSKSDLVNLLNGVEPNAPEPDSETIVVE